MCLSKKASKGNSEFFRTARSKAGIQDLRFMTFGIARQRIYAGRCECDDGYADHRHKSPHMWKRYNTVAEVDLLSAANRLSSYLSNTVIAPADFQENAHAVSA
jgi:hypothetical protein